MSKYNLLVLSDVHLGSDLVHHARPDAPPRGAASARRDRELVACLNWYRDHRREKRPWRLVIAGDFVDFVGMSISPEVEARLTELDDEERALGLGGAADHTIFKLRRVARHHREVFQSLAMFIAAGNTLVVVRGNHDVDFHWRRVQDEFVRQLSLHVKVERGSVEFAPWFYYEEGRVYIEHGHQYDGYCSYEYPLHPVSPRDPRRSWRSLSDVLLRYVVRPTRGMTESGHDGAGVTDYLRFAFRLGLFGLLGLLGRFVRAVTVLLRLWREHFSNAARRLRADHERRMALLAAVAEVSVERLRALASLQRPPVTRSLPRLLASLMLDRVLLWSTGCMAVGVSVVVAPSWLHGLLIAACIGLMLAVVGWIWAGTRVSVDPSGELRDRATAIAKLFPAAVVVMGHTHHPEVRATRSADTTYVNLGAWAEEEAPDGTGSTLPATRTHLVVSQEQDRLVAELLVWDSERGPRHFLSSGTEIPSGERSASDAGLDASADSSADSSMVA